MKRRRKLPRRLREEQGPEHYMSGSEERLQNRQMRRYVPSFEEGMAFLYGDEVPELHEFNQNPIYRLKKGRGEPSRAERNRFARFNHFVDKALH